MVKKRNRVDPIIQMAKKNQAASIVRMRAATHDAFVKKSRRDDEQSAKKTLDVELATQRLFQEMQRREF